MSLYSVYFEHQKTQQRFYLHSGVEATWNFRTGGYASRNAFVFSQQEYEKLKRADSSGPYDLVYQQDQDERRVQRLWLVEFTRAIESHEMLVWFADRRWEIEHLLVDSDFNWLRVANSKERPGAPVPANVALTNQVPLRHFIPGTCCDPNSTVDDPYFANPDVGFDEVRPWTALQALRFLVSQRFIDLYCSGPDRLEDPAGDPVDLFHIEKPSVVDTKFVLRKYNPRSSWANAISELSRYARTLVYVDEIGDYVFESADAGLSAPVIKSGGYGQYQGSGAIPITNDASSSSPRKLKVFFPRYDEVLWQYDEEEYYAKWLSTFDHFDPASNERGTAFGEDRFVLENVIRNPNDVQPDKATGRPRAGELWNIFDLLKHWSEDTANQPRNSLYTPTQVFSLEAILRLSLHTGLAHLYQKDFYQEGYKNRVLEARVASIYNYFRTTFKIPEFWMNYIEDVRAVSSDIFSTTSRARQPARVIMDWNAWDTTIYRYNKTKDGQGYVRNNTIDNTSIDLFGPLPALKPLHQLLTPGVYPTLANSAAEATIGQRELGLINVSFPVDHSGVTLRQMAGLIDPRTIPSYNLGSLEGSGWIDQMRLLPTFRMGIVLAIRWRAPNARSKYHQVTFQGKDFIPGSKGPEMNIYENEFEAFRRFVRGDEVSWRRDPTTGMMDIQHTGDIGNEPILQELARADAEIAYYKFLPRIIGTFRAKGWTLAMPKGSIRNTAITLGSQGAAETIVNSETAPGSPSIWEFFRPETRNVLGRFEKNMELGDL